MNEDGFDRIAAIERAKEAANQNDETRKTFEILCREVFRRFKSCLTNPAVNQYREPHDALSAIYKFLQEDKQAAGITDIIRQLQEIVDAAITVRPPGAHEPESQVYDISRIDFDKLRAEFEHQKNPNSAVQQLKMVVEERLRKLLAKNPLRTDFQSHYEEIIAQYNSEKDRAVIEATWEALIKFVEELTVEETRHVREGLAEEDLALFDLLKKDNLSKQEIDHVKKVAHALLTKLKIQIKDLHEWREKESGRDAIKIAIKNFLWDDQIGLPSPAYSQDDVEAKTEQVYEHIYRAYPKIPSPIYTS